MQRDADAASSRCSRRVSAPQVQLHMRPLDWAVLAALLLGPALLGTWRAVRDARRAARRAARRPGNRPPGDDGVGDPGDSGEKRERGRSTSMGVITVGLSLLASNLSGITLLGYPAEVYQYGSQFWMVGAGAALATAVLSVSFLPVLHGLKLHSSHEVRTSTWSDGSTAG